MKTVFISGASGFVGSYLRKELVANGYKVVGSDLRSGGSEYLMDVTNKEDVNRVIAEVKPDYIVHLAGFSSVKDSFDKPDLCYKINVEGTRNIFDAVRNNKLATLILAVSSADTYGNSDNKITESHPKLSRSPYSHSRIEQEKLIKTYEDVNWIISRSFPHIGPGQPMGFVSSDFASQIAEINKDKSLPHEVRVGVLSGVRDFTDVRDTVVAYRLLLEKGINHEVYNVCSGREIRISQILESFLELSNVKIDVIEDPEKIRPLDIKYNVGDNSKLIDATGWKIKYSIEQTLQDIYNYWINHD